MLYGLFKVASESIYAVKSCVYGAGRPSARIRMFSGQFLVTVGGKWTNTSYQTMLRLLHEDKVRLDQGYMNSKRIVIKNCIS